MQRKSVYLSKSAIAELMDCDRHTVQRQCQGLEEFNAKHHRYAYPFHKRKVHIGVYIDWQAKKGQLLDERTREHVPPFNPYEALAYAGIGGADETE